MVASLWFVRVPWASCVSSKFPWPLPFLLERPFRLPLVRSAPSAACPKATALEQARAARSPSLLRYQQPRMQMVQAPQRMELEAESVRVRTRLAAVKQRAPGLARQAQAERA